MKLIKLLILGLLLSHFNLYSNDCSYCNVVLAKDIISESRDVIRICQALDIIQQGEYEAFKSSGSWSGAADILGLIGAEAESTWSEFKEKRKEFFKKQQYAENYSESLRSLKTITSEFAYPEWGKCIKGCQEKDESKCSAYALLVREGKQFIEIQINYYRGAKCHLAPPEVGGKLMMDNGHVVSPSKSDKNTYAFSIKSGQAPYTIIIERKDTLKETRIQLISKKFEEFKTIYSLYKSPPAYAYCSVNLKGATESASSSFVKWESATKQTDELGNLECYISGSGGPILNPLCANLGDRLDCSGRFCFGKHEIELPKLGAGYFYANPESLQAIDDPTGSWGWNMGNDIQERQYVGGQNAKITFRLGASKMVVRWRVQVWRNEVLPSEVNIPIPISGYRFVVETPSGLKNPKLRFSKNGNVEDVDLGEDSLDKRLKFLGMTKDGRSYNYMIENSYVVAN